jgi:septal ring factor EnvC (AmiA/AmiB activator)
MKEAEFGERFERLEKQVDDGFSRMEAGFAHLSGLIDSLASLCAREFVSISEDFAQVSKRLDDVESKIEAFAQRADFEAEERHKLADRVLQLEQPPANSTRQ